MLRLEHRMSQAEFGKRVNISQSSIAYWETGKRSPKIEQVWKIADAFNMNWEDLMDDDFTSSRKAMNNSEFEILKSYRELNAEGKKMLLAFAQSLIYNPLYGSGNSTSLMADAIYDGMKDQKAIEDYTREELEKLK